MLFQREILFVQLPQACYFGDVPPRIDLPTKDRMPQFLVWHRLGLVSNSHLSIGSLASNSLTCLAFTIQKSGGNVVADRQMANHRSANTAESSSGLKTDPEPPMAHCLGVASMVSAQRWRRVGSGGGMPRCLVQMKSVTGRPAR